MRRHTQDVHLGPLDPLLQVAQSSSFGAVVRVCDEGIDFSFVLCEEGINVLAVEKRGALRPGHDEVEVQEEAEPGIERDPGEDKIEGRFKKVEE